MAFTRVRFGTVCTATVLETWEADVPAGLSTEDLHDHLRDLLIGGGSGEGRPSLIFIEQEVIDEHDRELDDGGVEEV